ncbi:receptor-like cytosolic serine/threonine-protein kinase RBK2 [Forsythia ovata]|uniref:Receptor-like cytosolic serine/threonine-protein kinase RBK2 n=1 Tax=Forsythia ovata TaxID=205694 RepID=A0ABD1VKJ7_9LAMI
MEKQKPNLCSPDTVLEDFFRSEDSETESSKASTSEIEAQKDRKPASLWAAFVHLFRNESKRQFTNLPPLNAFKLSKKFSSSMREYACGLSNPLIDSNLSHFKPQWKNFSFSELQTATNCFCQDSKEKLKWDIRHKVALGTAKGLLYLHEGCQRRITHRDIKAANIFLTEDFEPQAKPLLKKNKIRELVDPSLADNYNSVQMNLMILAASLMSEENTGAQRQAPKLNERILSSLSRRSVAAHPWHDLEIAADSDKGVDAASIEGETGALPETVRDSESWRGGGARENRDFNKNGVWVWSISVKLYEKMRENEIFRV